MPILSPSDAARVREMLADLPNPVRLVFFTQTLNCETCEPTKQILGEVAGLSGQITVEEHNFLLEQELAASYGVDCVPAVVPLGRQDHGIRFLGMPSGYTLGCLHVATLAGIASPRDWTEQNSGQ